MGFPYTKILCPLDFDDNSLGALDKAIEIARHFKATMGLVHVVPLVMQFGEVPIPPGLYEEQRKDAEARLSDIARSSLATSSTSDRLYRRRGRQHNAGRCELQSRPARDGDAWAGRLSTSVSRQRGRGCRTPRGLPSAKNPTRAFVGSEYSARFTIQEETARQKLRDIAGKRLAGLKYELLTHMGDPAGTILKEVKKTGADLVVMATHWRRDFPAHLPYGPR